MSTANPIHEVELSVIKWDPVIQRLEPSRVDTDPNRLFRHNWAFIMNTKRQSRLMIKKNNVWEPRCQVMMGEWDASSLVFMCIGLDMKPSI